MKKCTVEYTVTDTRLVSFPLPDALDPNTLDMDSILHIIYDVEDKDSDTVEIVDSRYTVKKVYPDETDAKIEEVDGGTGNVAQLSAEEAYDFVFNADARFEDIDDFMEPDEDDDIVYLPQELQH